MDGNGYEHLTVRSGLISLHAVAAGPADGPLVILLHGFPEYWYGWRHQIDALAAAGFRVIAPDGRGYNQSDKPARIKDYALSELASDVLAVADGCGRKQFFLAGHDWGAAVAWHVALTCPQRVKRLAILNVPHPAVMKRFVSTHLSQIRRSWYMLLFQIPALPERLFFAANFRMGAGSLTRSSKPGTFTEEDLKLYREAWSRPGAVRSMIHWYRALFRYRPVYRNISVQVPVRIIWGQQDMFLLPQMADTSLRHCPDGNLTMIEDATHWVQHEKADLVNRLLTDWFTRSAR
jgi:epoxide hydrolase 4